MSSIGRSAARGRGLGGSVNLSVLGLMFLRAVALALPLDALSWLGARIGRTLGPRTRRHKRAVGNIARALPGLGSEAIEDVALGMWDNFGRVVAESLVISRLVKDERRIVFEDGEKIAALTEGGQGVIFVGLHFGNWEVTVAPAVRLGLDPIALYKPLKDDKADAFLRSLRSSLYPSGLVSSSASSLLQVARHLGRGGSMCMLADFRDVSGPAVPFFGALARSSALAARLHVAYGMPIVAARVDRVGGARFRVSVEVVAGRGNVVEGTEESRAEAVVATTAGVQKVFEAWIRKRPDQWVWFYNRW